MKIVLDTNVLLAILPKTSKYRVIIDNLILGNIELIVSTAILLEYQEIIARKTNLIVAHNFLEFVTKRTNVSYVEPPYLWSLIEQDKDDNKFVDAALIGGANFIVTNDSHFDVLKNIAFPKVATIRLDEFMKHL